MKTLLFLTSGDGTDPNTWSGVSALIYKNFKSIGYNIINVDMSVKQNIFTKLYSIFFILLTRKNYYFWGRSIFCRKLVERKLKSIVKKYDNDVDYYFVLSYDYSPKKFTNKKVILFSDWVISWHIEKVANRKMNMLERKSADRAIENIRNADYTFTIVKSVQVYLKEKYDLDINCLYMPLNAYTDSVGYDNYYDRDNITFIGKKTYIESAIKLIDAFNKLNNTKYYLHIIGLNKNDFNGINIDNPNISFHGYLSKGKKEEFDLYQDIIKHSIVMVNTTPGWNGLSSVFECMYYYRPYILSKNEELELRFGDTLSFGYYSDNSVDDIYKNLEKIINLDDDKYKDLCDNAHNIASQTEFKKYITSLMNIVDGDK